METTGKLKDIAAEVHPLAGFAFVEMQGIYDAGAGAIIIPERLKVKRHGFGILRDVTPTQKDDRTIGMPYSSVIGSRIIFADYAKALIDETNIFRIPISTILAIITDANVKIEEVKDFQGVERCQWCGPASAGSSNSMILDMSGYCPRCGKNSSGEQKDEFSQDRLKPFRNPI